MPAGDDWLREHNVEIVTECVGVRWQGMMYPLQPYLARLLKMLVKHGSVSAEQIAERRTTSSVYISHLRAFIVETGLPITIRTEKNLYVAEFHHPVSELGVLGAMGKD